MTRLSLSILSVCSVLAAGAVQAQQSDPNAIMKQVYNATVTDKRSGRMRLTVQGPGGDKQERFIRVRAKGDDQARMSLLLVEAPADVRGTGFVSIEHPNTDSDAERWLYLPKLKRTTRVAGSQLSSSFLGSDLSFADLVQPNPKHFEFRLVKEESIDGEQCWVIDGRPKEQDTAKEVGYSEARMWISKTKNALVRMRVSLTDSHRQKYFQASQFRQVGGTWMPDKLFVRTVENGKTVSESTLQALENKLDPSVTDEDFTKQRLEQGL